MHDQLLPPKFLDVQYNKYIVDDKPLNNIIILRIIIIIIIII